MKVLERHEAKSVHVKLGWVFVSIRPLEPPLKPVLNVHARGPPGETLEGRGLRLLHLVASSYSA